MFNDFPLYTTDYISGVMSLRKPQTKSLKILEEITNAVPLRKGMNLKAALGAVHAMYPICTDFERDFMSLTFALATGVGKTRLMGAFIAYLYTQHNIRNFFVVAPNTTIYEKLKKDLSDNGSPKYVFRGLGCFTVQPQIITDDDYREKNLSLFESDVHIFVYNIDKFNKEGANMKKVNELIGDSFYQALSDLPDLVLIMDESHHYRAERGMQALNELHPLLGLELTATPLVTKGNKQVPFKNVVYEYPLSKAIEDGYTRTPFAVTRSDIDFYNFGDEQLDKMMLLDGITCHESTKRKLEVYKFIPIPRIKVTDAGVEEYVFVDFDLDMAEFTHVPIRNELLVQNLEDMQDRQRIKGNAIDFEGYNPKKVILEQLRAKPEIDYEKCSKLLFKLITQVCDHYETRYGTNGMQNIIMMYKRDIGNKIYKQMLQHFYCENGFLQEEVVGTRKYNLQQSYRYSERANLFSDEYTENIQSVLFEGIKRGVFSTAKFDSRPELLLARILETESADVQNWLRPAPQEFNITYNHGHNYEPDFVVETEDTIYLVEVKGEDKLNDPDVIAKKKRGIQYCEVASRWGKANGYKKWRYLFIPSKQVMPNSSFMQLAKRFGEY